MTNDPAQPDQSRQPQEARSQHEAAPADLSREAANMRELLSRQSDSATPLSVSSRAAQAVLKQF